MEGKAGERRGESDGAGRPPRHLPGGLQASSSGVAPSHSLPVLPTVFPPFGDRDGPTLPPIAARGYGAEPVVGAGIPRAPSIDEFELTASQAKPKPKPVVKLSAQSLKAVELSKQITAKKKELDQEKHIAAQIKELQRQLELEKQRRKENALAREVHTARRKLIVALPQLPYAVIDRHAEAAAQMSAAAPPPPDEVPPPGVDGLGGGGLGGGGGRGGPRAIDALGTSPRGGHLALPPPAPSGPRFELAERRLELSTLDGVSSLKHFDVTMIGTVETAASDEASLGTIRELLSERGCVPLFTPAPDGGGGGGHGSSAAQHARHSTLSEDTLWPLFHYIPLSSLEADLSDTQRRQWDEYERMNKLFADQISELVESESAELVWVHDVHLMLVPQLLRERHAKLKIGWFLHTPFPSSEIYLTLPRRREILRGVLAADLLGFHIYDYVRHFMNACMRVLATDIAVDHKYVRDAANRHAAAVDAFPGGIEPSRYQRALSTPAVKDLIIDLQRRFDGKRIILGLDLLDFVKGIPHKLMAYEKFLSDYPAWRERTTLVQIAVPREGRNMSMAKLKNKVHKLVGRINGRFGTLEHSPIHYLDQAISFEQQVALSFLADVAMMTSLREGMSHAAFEYIACQSRNHGVLILSEFAGAAQALGSGAIMVNPFNTDEMASAIDSALVMSAREREERHGRMLEYVQKFTASWWAENFATEMMTQEHDPALPSHLDTLSTPEPLPSAALLERYGATGRRLIITGLLGVLLSYSAFKNLEPLAESTYQALAALCADPRNTVVVVTGRERALAQQWLGNLPVWLAAENGVFYRRGGRSAEWQCAIEATPETSSWMAGVRPVFKYFEQRTPCTFTEVQEHTMTWHYREADEDFGEIQASDLQLHLDKVLGNTPVEVSLDAKQVSVRPYGISKGAVLEQLMEELTHYRRDTVAGAGSVAGSVPISAMPSAAGGLGEAGLAPPGPSCSSVALAASSIAEGPSTADIADVLSAEPRSPRPLGAPPPPALGAFAERERAAMSSSAPQLDALERGAEQHAPLGAAPHLPSAARTEPRSVGSDLDMLSLHGLSAKAAALDFVLCIGDLTTRDEDLFGNLTAPDSPYQEWLPGPTATFTVSVGAPEPTQARYYVDALKDVDEILRTLGAVSAAAPTPPPPAGYPESHSAPLGTPEARAASRDEEVLSASMVAEPLNALPSAFSLLHAEEEGAAAAAAAEAAGAPHGGGADPIGPPPPPLPFRGRKIAFFLDYDGTLTPIVEHPEDAVLSESMREVVRSLAALYPTAIVSGRPIATAHGFVKLDELYYAGNHGMDIAGPTNSLIKHQVVDDMYRPALESAQKQLRERLSEVEGLLLEDNRFSLSVHYRAVASEADRNKVAEAVEAILSDMPMLRRTEGKMVHELRPEVDWNKGRAVEWLLENLKEEYGADDLFPIYIGDDTTDEDAFRTLTDHGVICSGIGIIVSDGLVAVGGSEATYQLKNPTEVGEFLGWFTRPEQAHLWWPNKKHYSDEQSRYADLRRASAPPQMFAQMFGGQPGAGAPGGGLPMVAPPTDDPAQLRNGSARASPRSSPRAQPTTEAPPTLLHHHR